VGNLLDDHRLHHLAADYFIGFWKKIDHASERARTRRSSVLSRRKAKREAAKQTSRAPSASSISANFSLIVRKRLSFSVPIRIVFGGQQRVASDCRFCVFDSGGHIVLWLLIEKTLWPYVRKHHPPDRTTISPPQLDGGHPGEDHLHRCVHASGSGFNWSRAFLR